MNNENRRKLLKSIAAGSGAVIAGKSLPENWARPVVDSIALPAHAQTSGNFSGNSFVEFGSVPSATLVAGLLDSLVPAARANNLIQTATIDYCVARSGDSAANVTIVVLADRLTCKEQYVLTTPAPVSLNVATPMNVEAACSNWAASYDGQHGLPFINDAVAAYASPVVTLTQLDGQVIGNLTWDWEVSIDEDFTLGVGACKAITPIVCCL